VLEWIERLVGHGIKHEGPVKRGSSPAETEQVISFRDHDGLMLEIVAHPGAEARPAWADAPGISRERAIHGFHGVTLWVEKGEATEKILVDTLGLLMSVALTQAAPFSRRARWKEPPRSAPPLWPTLQRYRLSVTAHRPLVLN